jgi:hypothetical protein
MADTLQAVQWALEQSCRLRTGKAVDDINGAAAAVSVASAYGRGLAKPDSRFGILGDVLIRSLRGAMLPQRLVPPSRSASDRILGRGKARDWPCSDIPHEGFIISEKFKDLGGPLGLQDMCRDCPANAGRPFPAGCVGWLLPCSTDSEGDLKTIISRLGLEAALAEHFVATTPIWFGLWAKPVLSPKAAGLLATLLTELTPVRGTGESEEAYIDRHEEFTAFISAARIAESEIARLRVWMPPPGHTDFGWYTVFAHCPLCKAEADLKRWKGKYPVALYTCKVCGTRYSPAKQASVERLSHPADPTSELRQVLGEARFREFAKEYLVREGMSDADAAETLNLTEARNLHWQRVWAQRAREGEMIQRYIDESLYDGLRVESTTLEGDPNATVKAFRAAEFERLIHRCAERKVTIEGMIHESSAEEMRRHVFRGIWRLKPLKIFRKWRAEGCDGLFWAFLEVPKELVAEFEKTRQPQNRTP